MIVNHDRIKSVISKYLCSLSCEENYKVTIKWINFNFGIKIRAAYFKKLLSELKAEGVKNISLVVFDKKFKSYKLREGVKVRGRL
jgi:hypothetical protein